jgi:type I restriction enzyme, S subunit
MSLDLISLAKTARFIVDNRGKTVPTVDKGIPLIKTNCITNEQLYPQIDGAFYISQEIYDTWFRAHPKPGDIILTLKGSQNGAACLVPNPVNFVIAQDMVAIRVNETVINAHYLLAALRSREVQHQIKTLDVSGVIPHLKKTDFDKLILQYPSREIQDYIGQLYFKLSSKIELLRQQNRDLEELAQTLFKRWFVEFEFPFDFAQGKPNENGEPYKSSGGKMVESELGEIPEGWRVGCLDDLIINYSNKRIPLSSNDRNKRKGIYPYYGASGIVDYIDDYIFEGKHILFSEDGENLRSRNTPIVFLVDGKFWVNNHAHILQGKKPYQFYFIYLHLLNVNIDPLITGAVQPKVNKANLHSLELLQPNDRVLKVFNEIASCLFNKFAVSSEEIQTLTQLRDTLLPKLMSGEIRVSE